MKKQYKAGLFESGLKTIIADKVENGMIIALSNNKYFYVDDMDKEFINDEVADLYADDVKESDIKHEHTTITFYDEDGNSIYGVLGTEKCIAFTRIDGDY